MVLGLDIGSSGCKAAVFDARGECRASARRVYSVHREPGGRVVFRARELETQLLDCLAECAAAAPEAIAAVTFSSFGEALVPVDAEGSVCGDSIPAADARGATVFSSFVRKFGRKKLEAVTGQPCGSGYSLPVLLAEPEEYASACQLLSWSDFLGFRLTGRAAFCNSLAARTLLYDVTRGAWSAEIASAAGVLLKKFPPILPSGTFLGAVSPEAAARTHLPTSCRVCVGMHDQCAATLGAGVSATDGTAMLGLGTFGCLVLPHRDRNRTGIGWNIEPHAVDGELVSFVYHGSCGALLAYLRNLLFPDCSFSAMFREAEAADFNRLPVVLPYFEESGPLDFRAGGNGMFGGLSFSQTRGEWCAGALCGILFYFKDALRILAERGISLRGVVLSGGVSQSEFLCRLAADVLNLPVSAALSAECGIFGCARLAAKTAGVELPVPAAARRYFPHPRPELEAAFVRFRRMKAL